MINGRAAAARIAVAGVLWAAIAAAAAPVSVEFINASRPVRCAEEDNVYVKIAGHGITSFRISAWHPPYIAAVTEDSTAPDFTHCDMSGDPTFSFEPRTVTLYEDARIRLVGHTFATFWRPDVVDFRVGDRVESGLHLVQLIRRGPQRDVEILVVYPADGYWRVKPLPPAALPDTAYGSSFIVGPIEESTRPFAAIRSIAFDPATLRFSIDFRDGRRGTLSVAAATPEHTRLAIAIKPALAAGRPFAALRSMFVTPAQADVAVASRPGAAPTPILELQRITARNARFGRVVPSQHNLSAPDLEFDAFSTGRPRPAH